MVASCFADIGSKLGETRFWSSETEEGRQVGQLGVSMRVCVLGYRQTFESPRERFIPSLELGRPISRTQVLAVRSHQACLNHCRRDHEGRYPDFLLVARHRQVWHRRRSDTGL